MNKPHILVIDGHNFMHRARSGFSKGEYAIVYNFFRNLRAQIELHSPTRVYFVLEGHPRARYEMMEGYKANRVIDPLVAPERHQAMVDFHRQVRIIIGLVREYLPISVIRHPHHEADDTIFNLINRSSRAIPWTVVSNDTDFIQLLDQFSNVSLFNPMKKEYIESPGYDYLTWKALRGDGSDCIPGIPGVGDKTATKLAIDLERLHHWLLEDKSRMNVFIRNLDLIRFMTWDDEESLQMQSWLHQAPSWAGFALAFKSMGFQSMLKEKTWKRFTETFEPLWGRDA
jgi:DNA polymerase-1